MLAACKRYLKRHPAKRKETAKKYRINNRDKLRAYGVEYYKQNKAKIVARITVRRREQRISQAGIARPNKCEICGSIEINMNKRGCKTKIVYDHCHSTGLFRGWICSRCNSVLGYVEDDINLLNKLIKYLKTFKGAYELSNNSAD